jgi:hypothetical protein
MGILFYYLPANYSKELSHLRDRFGLYKDLHPVSLRNLRIPKAQTYADYCASAVLPAVDYH